MSEIKLHPEYGLNPTLSKCFYCGKETGEIALLGSAYKGEAPMHMVTSIEPCDECKETYKEYTLLVEAVQPPLTGRQRNPKPPEPTGRWVAVKRECLDIDPTPIAFVDERTISHIISLVPKEVG